MTIYSQGSYDILHSGHVNILRKCRKLAGKDGKVVVALTSDAFYKEYRGYEPAKPFSERKALLGEFRDVDEIVEATKETTREQILRLNPDFVVLGSDWASKDVYEQYGMSKEELDPYLVFFPYTTTISSTQIKERIKNQ
jgi:glycerol-3-phosphate cytidylyltransferase